MEINMKIAYIGLIGILIGAVIAGGITLLVSFLQFNHQNKQEKRKRKIENIETIHRLLSTITYEVQIMCMKYFGYLNWNIEPKTESKKEKIPMDELRMLVDFYVPNLKIEINLINKKWVELGEVLAKFFLKPPTTQDEKTKLIANFTEIPTTMQMLSEKAKEKLTKIINKIT